MITITLFGYLIMAYSKTTGEFSGLKAHHCFALFFSKPFACERVCD